jgi:two-component system response regulator YesN
VKSAIPSAFIDDERHTATADRVEFALGYYRHLVKLREYVARHLHEPFDVSEAASEVGISPSRLSHLFYEKTGVAFSDWVRQERIISSMSLLRVSDRSIGEIAHSVGFRNSRTFERSFKKATGLTPSEYRRIVLRQNLSHDYLQVPQAP